MYKEVYNEMVKGGIAVKLPSNVFLNKNGDQVQEVKDSFGLPTRCILQYPDNLLFVDEVGSNTSTSKDGNVGGEKFLCEAMSRPQVRAATKDSHFTVLGFTTVSGLPVMCGIIFAAKEMDESWALGFNATADWVGDQDDIDANAGGIGKRYPMGPECIFKGVKVPTFCGCSENGSITAELLVSMLQAIDGLNIFKRLDAEPAPFLLLDGHGSRFDLQFLQYINCPETKWNVCIGVPYGTSYWQVGDSTEQNGCFKMSLARHKRNLLTVKEQRGEEFAIEKRDVVLLVLQAWEDSFARVESNQNAISERGWSPLTFNCLLDPEIQATKYNSISTNGRGQDPQDPQQPQILQEPSSPPGEGVVAAEDLNLTRGLAGTLIDSIVELRMRDDARNGVNLEENRRKRKQTAELALNNSKKRYTAGIHVAAGRFLLGPDVLRNIQERKLHQEEKQHEKLGGKIRDFRALKDRVTAIRELAQPHQQLNVTQLRTMVLWFKQTTDLPAPTTRQLLLTQLDMTCMRNDPIEPSGQGEQGCLLP
jgi:hypothetical protein